MAKILDGASERGAGGDGIWEKTVPRIVHEEALSGNTDELVAVSTNSTEAGYLGEAYNDGVLRTGGLIDYANGIDFVTLSVDAGNVASNLNTGYVVITNILESDPYFVAYSNSAAFTNDVRAAQTNDGYEANTDAKVGVTSNSTPDYLGKTGANGALRTDATITYTASTNYITLSAVASNSVPNGTGRGQVLWWDESVTNWIVTTTPPNPAVLVFDKKVDKSNGSVRWENIDTDYKGIFRGTDDNMSGDWVRAHD